MYNNVEVCTMIQNCTKECKRMQYAYSYAAYMMQCQGAWRHGGAYIHTPYTALIWQTSNDKEKQTLRYKKKIRAYVNTPATGKLAISE